MPPVTQSRIAAAAQAPAKPALSGLRKAAILLVALGEQVSGEIVRQLTEEEVQTISREVAKHTDASQDTVSDVLQEFYQLTSAHASISAGGLDYAKNMLVKAFGADSARKQLERLERVMGLSAVHFETLQKADPQQLAELMRHEHPQTVALVLAHMSPSQAAALLAALQPEVRADVAVRVAKLDQFSPDVIARIATVIRQRLNAAGEFSRESSGGVRAVAEMFNRLEPSVSKDVLGTIESWDNNLGESIRRLMFVFEDILNIDENGMRAIIGGVDRKILLMALKGTNEELKDHFLRHMSQRGATMLREDMEALGPIKIRVVETAQQQVIAVIRQLEADGLLSMRTAVEDQYVL